ncbi:hypothetical protein METBISCDRAFT_31891 [Metschnikowia bicuspidata]|uniref:SET domain-containing protein n=1 Tax=Metschnikowia bicuspidata TaxID=27322 RepID=A0A4P9ZBC5_9ASCO|nr:hypothetical protein METBISCDRAFT_31891 [Metschnikowia bicuspidata]
MNNKKILLKLSWNNSYQVLVHALHRSKRSLPNLHTPRLQTENQILPSGTTILTTGIPVGSSVVRPFRKEVCTWCFAYHDGKTLKYRIDGKIYFYSSACLVVFSEYDPFHILRNTLIEGLYLKCEGEIQDEEVPLTENLADVIQKRWDEVSAWKVAVKRLKISKRQKFYPTVTAEDYAESNLYMDKEQTKNENELSKLLQSSEVEKVKKYPYILVSYTSIYKFVRLVVPDCLLLWVNPNNIRSIIGRNLTNALGIWSSVTEQDEEREYFGFGVHPSASYFNHSCDPNVQKLRVGNRYEFFASRDISPGEELKSDNVKERRRILKECFYVCELAS